MPEYDYRARDHQGARRAGTIQASNRVTAISQLRQRGWIIVGIDERRASPMQSLRMWWPIRPLQVELALQQIAVTVRTGMTLTAAIDLLRQQSKNQSIGRVWPAIQQRLQAGVSLSQAMQAHRCFPDFAIQLVRVGEQTGQLAPVLDRCVETMRRRRLARQEFVSAAIYPLLVIVLALIATIYMVAYLIPRLEIYLVSLGKQLPPMTQQLLGTAHWLRENGVWLLFGTILIAVGWIIAWRWPMSRLWLDRTWLRLPVLGNLIRLKESASFSRIAGMLLASGITLAESLSSVPFLLSNQYLAKVVREARDRILRGGQLAEALDQPNGFSPVLISMIRVGEQTGDLTRVLGEATDYHETQFIGLTQRVKAAATPALTLVIGTVVGYVYVAFFVALFAGGAAG